jgi:hypothetical protein
MEDHMTTVQRYTYTKVAEDRWQVNQGAQFVAMRATEAEAQDTVTRYNDEEVAAGNTFAAPRGWDSVGAGEDWRDVRAARDFARD